MAAKLARFGYRNIKLLQGGFLKWSELKYPVEKKIITANKALLDRNNKTTEAEVRDALGGNLCRCGAY